MLKSRTETHDGRGNCPVRSPSNSPNALDTLSGRPLYAEQWASFVVEFAVVVLKTKDDAPPDETSVTKAFPVVESIMRTAYANSSTHPRASFHPP